MNVMPPMVCGDGEANPWLPGIYSVITPPSSTIREIFQELPCTYIKLTREVGNACKMNRKMEEINLFQTKTNPPSVFWIEITDINMTSIT